MNKENLPYNEKELLLKVTEGDIEAYTILYNAYRHKLYAFLVRLTRSKDMAGDIVQDIFLKIWEERHKLKAVEHFDAYFRSMVRNRSLNLLKRIALEDEIIEELTRKEGHTPVSIEDPVLYNELRKRMELLINQLPEQQQRVYRLSKEEGMKQEDIADLLGITLPTVKTHLSRAKQFLRTKLISIFLFI